MTRPHAPFAQLSDREKAVLRLLSKSHDPKSIARELGLSVHTVNEYLRSARRKLAVGSSREAARLLSDHEAASSKNFGDEKIGVEDVSAHGDDWRVRSDLKFSGRHMVLAIGATFAMSLIVAAALFAWMTVEPTSGPFSNWAIAKDAPKSESLVINKILVDGERLLWNGSPISETQAREFLHITTEMSPQPLLVFTYSASATPANKQRARQLINEELRCTPSLCLEVVTPVQ